MTNRPMNLFKTMSEKAKETALEGKERFTKWTETEKMKKFKDMTKRKDAIGYDILQIKEQLAHTQATLSHLQEVRVEAVDVLVEGIAISVSIDTLRQEYEEKVRRLTKQKDQLSRTFLSLEEKINNDTQTAKKVEEMAQQKVMRLRVIKEDEKHVALANLLPFLTTLPPHLAKDNELIAEEAFGLVELRYQDNRLECMHNGLIVHLQLDPLHQIEHVSIVDWRQDEAIYLASGSSSDITLLDWQHHHYSHYEQAFFDMNRAVKYLSVHYFEQD